MTKTVSVTVPGPGAVGVRNALTRLQKITYLLNEVRLASLYEGRDELSLTWESK